MSYTLYFHNPMAKFGVKQIQNDFSLAQNGILPFKISTIPPLNLPMITFCKYFVGVKKVTEGEAYSIFMEYVEEPTDSTHIHGWL